MLTKKEEAKVKQLIKELSAKAHGKDPLWFKQGKGEYAEHDKFLGISIPELRIVVKSYENLLILSLKKLLLSPFNEVRLSALLILVKQFQKAKMPALQQKIFNFYVKNHKYVNNWNLVDSSAHLIIGAYLFDKDKTLLYRWAKANNLWKRRIAIISTWYFIRQGSFKETLEITKLLLNDPEDLLHKATGWMLREVGKRDPKVLERFLQKHHLSMPRVMLRYAIEHFSQRKRSFYLSK